MSPITANATAETASAQQEATNSRSRWTPSSDGGGAVEATDAAIGLPLSVRSCGGRGSAHPRGQVLLMEGESWSGCKQSAQERETIARERVGIGRERPPDGGRSRDGLDAIREGLDDDPARVVDLVQCRGDVAPRQVARTRRAAVVLRDLHVHEVTAGSAQRVADILLFDAQMKEIEREPDRRMVHAPDELE